MKENKLATFGIVYFTLGLLFASIYALFYHWPPLSFLSPGFYAVVLTWPVQLPGLVWDFQIYGFAGKFIL